MNGSSFLQRIRQSVRQKLYSLTIHAQRECDSDSITIEELEEAFGSEQIELLEDYPDDARGHSVLVLGFGKAASPIHAVIGLSRQRLVFITVYRPDPDEWYDWRRRT